MPGFAGWAATDPRGESGLHPAGTLRHHEYFGLDSAASVEEWEGDLVRATPFTPLAILLVALFSLAAVGGPRYRPLSVGDDLETLRRELEKSVRLRDLQGAASTVRKIGGLQSREAVETLLVASVAFPEEEVYRSICESLVGVTDPGGVAFLATVLRHGRGLDRQFDSWRHRVTVGKVFGDRADEATFDPLLAAIGDKAFPVRRQALQSLGKRGDRRAVPSVIDLLEEKEDAPGLLWEDALRCLREITRQDLRESVDWRVWWKAHGEEAPSPPRKEPTDPDNPQETQDVSAHFFGVEIVSKRIVFVIDVSGSMKLWDPGGDGEQPRGGGESFSRSRQRIHRAKRELIRVIKDLRPRVRFNILTFSHELNALRPGKLISASRKNKARAIRFVQSLEADGGTATDEALEEAFVYEEANTIILLSDGLVDKPGGGNPTVTKMLKMVRKLNRFRKVRIHTFGFDGEGKKSPGMQTGPRLNPGLLKDFREMMVKLAKEHDGKYTSIR